MPQGGHTSEMLKLTSRLSPETYSPLCYVVASTDHTSADRIPKEGLMSGRCRVRTIPRSREVMMVPEHLYIVYIGETGGVRRSTATCPTRNEAKEPGSNSQLQQRRRATGLRL